MRTITFTYENDDGEEIEASLPAKREVCWRCDGDGTHVNPSIDGNGITASEWAEWDDEERDHYMSGVYDVMCDMCKGANVILVIDEEACAGNVHYPAYLAQQEAEAQSRAEDAYERRMFAGDY